MTVVSELEASTPHEAVARVVVQNECGLHVRPCNRILETLRRYRSDFFLQKLGPDGEPTGSQVNGRSATSILMLEAPQGTEIALRAVGPDASSLIEEMVALFETRFGIDAD